jgi:dimeric dUTPase (all-alpha-NTP-PPase superfamily)
VVEMERFMEGLILGLEALVEMQSQGARNLPDHLQPLDQGELVNECQWKPWRSYTRPTPAERQRVLKELADVLHFLPWVIRNLEDRFHITTADIALAAWEAHEENIERFRGQVPGREPPLHP